MRSVVRRGKRVAAYKLPKTLAQAVKEVTLSLLRLPEGVRPYPEGISAAREIIGRFKAGETQVLLNAPMQSGKTGALIATMRMFVRAFPSKKKPFLLYFSNIHDNVLKDQCDVRLTAAHLTEGGMTKVMHLAQIKKGSKVREEVRKRLKQSDYVLVVFDEGHWGTAKDGALDSMLKESGIDPCLLRRANVFFLWASATPYQHMAAKINGDLDVSVVPLEVAPGFIGTVELHAKGLFRQAPPLLSREDKSKVSKEADQVISEFLSLCEEKGPGYAVLRVKSLKQATILADHLKRKGVESDIYTCRHKELDPRLRPISFLYERLKILPGSAHAQILIHGMRAGKTLETSQLCYIRMHVDFLGLTPTGTAEAVAQSVGRYCGYNKDTNFPIYCDLNMLEIHIQYERELRSGAEIQTVPPGTHNTGSKSKNGYDEYVFAQGLKAKTIAGMKKKDRMPLHPGLAIVSWSSKAGQKAKSASTERRRRSYSPHAGQLLKPGDWTRAFYIDTPGPWRHMYNAYYGKELPDWNTGKMVKVGRKTLIVSSVKLHPDHVPARATSGMFSKDEPSSRRWN